MTSAKQPKPRVVNHVALIQYLNVFFLSFKYRIKSKTAFLNKQNKGGKRHGLLKKIIADSWEVWARYKFTPEEDSISFQRMR